MRLPSFQDDTGKPSFTLTASALALSCVLAKVLLGGSTYGHAGYTVSVGPADAGVIAALLTPTLGAYVVRRGQDATAQAAPK